MNTKRNYIWATIDKVGGVGLAFLFNLVMARWFLSPREFGIIGMLQIFISLGYTTVIAGFGQSLIQTKELTKADISTVFTTNLLLALFVYAIFFVSAPYIAIFYNEPILKDVLRVIGLQLIICSFFIVQYNIALRESQLRKLCLITLTSSILGYIFGVILAKNGAGVWSLVVATLSLYFFQTIGLWLTTKSYPTLGLSKKSFKKLVPFSGFIYLTTLIDQSYVHGLSMILGKQFNATTLGYYTQANKLQMVPSQAIQDIGYQVLFPVFSRQQVSLPLIRQQYSKNTKIITGFALLAFSLLYVIGEPLIQLLFTDKWLPASPMLKVLAPAGLFAVLASIPTILIRSMGKANTYFILTVIERLIGLGLLIYFSVIGLWETLWALVGINIISYLINTFFVYKLIGVSLKEQIIDVLLLVLIQGVISIGIEQLLSVASYGFFVDLVARILVVSVAWAILLLSIKWVTPSMVRRLMVQLKNVYKSK